MRNVWNRRREAGQSAYVLNYILYMMGVHELHYSRDEISSLIQCLLAQSTRGRKHIAIRG